MTALSHDEWSEALASRFFSRDFAGQHVLFFVDRSTLAAIADVGEDEATNSFVSALKPRLATSRPIKLFQPIVSETARWKTAGGEAVPPCLPTLGLTVLAASEMRKTIEVAANNYYDWIVKLLLGGGIDADRGAVVESYGDAVPSLWKWLQWWLDQKHRGRLGLSTIEAHPHWTKIGYADSQTIFKSSDQEKLAQFFRWIALAPGEEVRPEELVEYFRAWVARRTDVNPGAEIMLADEDEQPAQLAALLSRAAGRWKGAVRTEEGRTEARLKVTLTGPPHPRLGLAAPAPPGFPPDLALQYLGRPLSLNVDQERVDPTEILWYQGLDLQVTTHMLSAGLSLSAGQFAFRLPASTVHILHMNADLGCWASVDQLSPGQAAWLLIEQSQVEGLRTFLTEHAAEGWSSVEGQTVTPKGWTLFRDVLVDAVEGDVAPELEQLAPRETNRFCFRGGLPLLRGVDTYLTGGDPDVTVPPLYGGVRIRVDDDEISMPPDAATLALAVMGLPEGTHEVKLGTLARNYSTIRTLRNRTPTPERAIGHAFKRGEDGAEPVSPDAGEVDGSAWLTVSGAAVYGDGAEASSDRLPQILPRAATDRILLGAMPGQIERVPVPSPPPWMKTLDLICREFEHYAAFPVAWLILLWSHKPPEVHRILDLPVQQPVGNGQEVAWAEAISSVHAAGPRFRSGENEWAPLVAVAAGLER